MKSGFKFYFLLVFILVGAQIVVAGENVVDFQRALEEYHKERSPNQAQEEGIQTELKKSFRNPVIEVKVSGSEQKARKR